MSLYSGGSASWRNTARVNGQEILIDSNNANVTPIVTPPGRTMLPLRFISEQLGCQVDWNYIQQMVTITGTRS